MIQTQIDLEELEIKTSKGFVEEIRRLAENVENNFKNKTILYVTEEDEYTLTVICAINGSLNKFEYRFTSEGINHNYLAWEDIRHFFDIPFGIESIQKSKNIS